jgi:hypothetical protein
MKTRFLLLCASFILLFLIPVGASAQEKYVPNANEELYGTWINDKTVNTFRIQKMVVSADGFKEYSVVSSSYPNDEVTQKIANKWKDSSGNIWYKVFGNIKTGPWKGRNFKALEKLSEGASVLEMVVSAFEGDFGSADYPNKIEHNSTFNGGYRIFYRTKT